MVAPTAWYGGMLLAGVGYLGVAWYVFEQEGVAVNALGATAAAIGAGEVVAALVGIATNGSPPEWWTAPFWLAMAVAIVPWSAFALQYTGRGRFVTRRRVVAGAATPIVGAGVIVAGGELAGNQTVLGVVTQAVGQTTFLGLLFLFGVGTALLLYTAATNARQNGWSTIGLWLVAAGPFLPSFLLPGFNDGTLTAMVVAGGSIAGIGGVTGAVGFGEPFRTTPAGGWLGRRRLADEIDDPVAFLNATDEVVDTNDAFLDAFAPGGAIGRSMAETAGAALSELRTRDSLELVTMNGRQQYAPRVTPVTDDRGRHRGTIVLFANVTDQKLREQRLSVLNRVVRHNLRNELNTVRGFAREIGSERMSNEVAADRIVEAADNLIALGERAREAGRLVGQDGTPRSIDLQGLVDTVAETVPDEATCVVEAENAPRVRTDRESLRRSLEHLTENAVIHNDADEPRVTLSVDPNPDGPYAVAVSVADNGPGIPDQEWAAIENEQETPLQHGSGLGLWAVHWAVVRLGGELEYESNDPRGSVVRVLLPAGDRTADSVGQSQSTVEAD